MLVPKIIIFATLIVISQASFAEGFDSDQPYDGGFLPKDFVQKVNEYLIKQNEVDRAFQDKFWTELRLKEKATFDSLGRSVSSLLE